MADTMQRSARTWLNLTQICVCIAWLAGCSGQLPLEIDTDPPELGRGRLPTEFAGSWVPPAGSAGWGGIMTPVEAICGDAVVTPPFESCDRSNLNGATCMSLGFSGGGVLSCNPTTCTYDTIMCRMTVGTLPPQAPPPIVPPPTKPPAGFEDAGVEDAGS